MVPDLPKQKNLPRQWRLLALATATSLALSLAGCSPKTDAELLADAQAAHAKGDDAAAQVLLKSYLANNPKQLEVRLLFAQVLNELEDGVGAERELLKAQQLGLDAGRYRVELARALYLQGSYSRILDEIKPDGLPVKDAAQVLAIRGNSLLALHRADEGRVQLESAQQLQPALSAARLGLARYWMTKKQFDRALGELDSVLRDAPKEKEAWLLKAEVLRAKNDLPAALNAYETVLKNYPSAVAASVGKATVLLNQNKVDAAQAAISAVRKRGSISVSIFYTQALIDYHNKKLNEAHTNILSALKIAPTDAPSQLLAGTIAFARHSNDEAAAYLGRYLADYPGDVKARKVLAYVHLANRQPQQAQDLLLPVIRELPDDVDTLAILGTAASQLGHYAQAMDWLRRAVELNPKSAPLLTELAASKLAGGQQQQGLDDLWRAARMDQKQSRADIMIVVSLVKKREFDQALAALAELEKKDPQNPVYMDLRGGVYLAKGDNVNARKSYAMAFGKQPTNTLLANNLAKIDLLENKPNDAIKRYQGILAKDKNNAAAMIALAQLYAAQQQIGSSVQWLERALVADPKNADAAIQLGNHYIIKGEAQKALTLAGRLRGQYPENAEVWRFLARTQLALGDKPSALASAKRVVSIAPSYALAWYELGGIAARLGNIDEAKQAFDKAVALAPTNLENKLALINLLMANGQFADARKIILQIQIAAPKAAFGYELEGDWYMQQKRYAEALAAYSKAGQLQRTSGLVVRIHQAQLRLGQADADDLVLAWLKQNPDDVTVRDAFAKSLMARKRQAEAIGQYQAILAKKPENLVALNNLALALFAADKNKAIGYAEQALKIAPKHPAVLDTLGWLLLQDEQLKRALPLLEEAQVAAADSYPEIHYHYAVALAKSGEKFRAKTVLQKALLMKQPFDEETQARQLLDNL